MLRFKGGGGGGGGESSVKEGTGVYTQEEVRASPEQVT